MRLRVGSNELPAFDIAPQRPSRRRCVALCGGVKSWANDAGLSIPQPFFVAVAAAKARHTSPKAALHLPSGARRPASTRDQVVGGSTPPPVSRTQPRCDLPGENGGQRHARCDHDRHRDHRVIAQRREENGQDSRAEQHSLNHHEDHRRNLCSHGHCSRPQLLRMQSKPEIRPTVPPHHELSTAGRSLVRPNSSQRHRKSAGSVGDAARPGDGRLAAPPSAPHSSSIAW